MGEVLEHRRGCNICEAMCGLVIRHDGENVLSIKADPDDPLSRGHICPKAIALQDFRTDPDRVTRPLKKVDGAFVEIGWDEAFDYAAERLRMVQAQHGKDGVGVYLGNPNAHKFGNLMNIPGMVRALGTTNRYSSATADQIPHHVASIHMFGHPMLIPVPDVERTDFMLILGGNPIVSNGSMMTAPGFGKRMDEIKARGGRVVVIDPRRTETAERAGEHHFIRPETDAFLLLALIHEVFAQGLDAPGALPIAGVETLKGAVAPFTAALAAKRTGIAEETIKTLARDFASAKSAVCYARMGASTQSFGSLCQWANNALNILTGNFDAPGGAMFTTPALNYVGLTPRKGKERTYPERRSRVSGQPLYNGEYPVSVMAEEMETPGEGQIKALVTIAGNPVLTAPNGRRIETALEGLEFMMSIDIHVNDTTRHADLILPGTVALEEVMYDMVFHSFAVRNTAGFAEALFEPPNGNPQEWEILATLAARIAGTNAPMPSPTQMLEGLLPRGYHGDTVTIPAMLESGTALDLGPLVPNIAERLETPDGQVHIAPQVFLDDLPRLMAFAPEENTDFPLQMIGRRLVRSHNSWTQNSPRLVKGRNRVTVQVHPQDAARIGLEEGGAARVVSRVGAVTMPVEISDEMAPGVVSIPQGWGQKKGRIEEAAGVGSVSINDLTDDARIDPISGNAAFNGVPVAVTPA
ncbi:MAG: molybdopterin-dependent oxidoreductase [Rhodobacteraceae bacterium]|nr:molybdopterin-dependent oxidoreductase [Paracoccaceae bacterium]